MSPFFQKYIEGTLEFVPLKVDSNIYYRRNRKPNGGYYYGLLLVYIDDILAISHKPGTIMEMIGHQFEIKNNEWGPPTRYLGANVEQFQLPDGSTRGAC